MEKIVKVTIAECRRGDYTPGEIFAACISAWIAASGPLSMVELRKLSAVFEACW